MHDPLTAALASGAALCALLAVACLAILHELPTGLHPVRDAVSLYGAGPFARWYRLQVTAAGSGALLLVTACARTDAARPLPLLALAIYGIARITIARYPTDTEGVAPTVAGRRHIILASVAFVAVGLAAPTIGQEIRALPGAGPLMQALAVLGLAVSASVLLTFAAGSLQRSGVHVFGAVERLFYVSSLAWQLAAGISLALIAA